MTTAEQRSLARRRRTIAIVASVIVTVLWTVVPLSTAQGPGTERLLARRYQEGDRFGYLMTARSSDVAYGVKLVETVVRDCTDVELADCGEPRRRRIFRRVEMLAAD